MTDGESRLLSSAGNAEFTGCSHLPKEYLHATLRPTNWRWFSEQRGRHQPTAKSRASDTQPKDERYSQKVRRQVDL